MESHEKVGEKEVLQKVVQSFISHAELQFMECLETHAQITQGFDDQATQ